MLFIRFLLWAYTLPLVFMSWCQFLSVFCHRHYYRELAKQSYVIQRHLIHRCFIVLLYTMMTSSNRNIFRVIGLLCGKFPSQRPAARSFDVFFDLHLNKRLSKQSWGWWFKTPLCPLWRHCNVRHQYGSHCFFADKLIFTLNAHLCIWFPCVLS